MYHHILVPLENSATDRCIIEHLRSLAAFMGSRLTLIHVADGFVARHQERLNLQDSLEIESDSVYLDRVQKELQGSGLVVDTILAKGEPADEILKASEKLQCDLIAMSTHGHRFIKDIVLGSVASEIRHRTHTPILMIRAK